MNQLHARLSRLEHADAERRRLNPPPDERDPWWRMWDTFRSVAYTVLEQGGHAAALTLVRQRVEANRSVFPGKGAILRTCMDGKLVDVRFFVMSATVWNALDQYPDARQALDHALVDPKVCAVFAALDAEVSAHAATAAGGAL